MPNWNIFKRSKPTDNLSFFRVVYSGYLVFGVTVASAQEAEALVCEEIFHNQTIPGFPVIQELSKKEVKSQLSDVSLQKIAQHYRIELAEIRLERGRIAKELEYGQYDYREG